MAPFLYDCDQCPASSYIGIDNAFLRNRNSVAKSDELQFKIKKSVIIKG